MRSPVWLAAVAVAALGASVAFAAEAPKPASAKGAAQTNKPSEAMPASHGGLVVFKDPVTGKLRQPTAEEIGILVGLAKPAAAAPAQAGRRLANGGLAFYADPSLDSYTVATKAADGRLVTSCVEGREQAEKAIAAGAPAPVREALDVK